jgi:hypothetical protein
MVGESDTFAASEIRRIKHRHQPSTSTHNCGCRVQRQFRKDLRHTTSPASVFAAGRTKPGSSFSPRGGAAASFGIPIGCSCVWASGQVQASSNKAYEIRFMINPVNRFACWSLQRAKQKFPCCDEGLVALAWKGGTGMASGQQHCWRAHKRNHIKQSLSVSAPQAYSYNFPIRKPTIGGPLEKPFGMS